MFTKVSIQWHLIGSFLIGAIFLSFLSIFQKVALGADPFAPMGFIIPVLFGGISGTVIGKHVMNVRKLNAKLQQRVNSLESFLPICANCKRIRKPDSNPKDMTSWEQMETYFTQRTSSQFSHSICPECMKKLYGDIIDENQ